MAMTALDWNLYSLLFTPESQCKFLRFFIDVYDALGFDKRGPLSHIVYSKNGELIPERPKKARRTYQKMLHDEIHATSVETPGKMYARLRAEITAALDSEERNVIAACVILVLYQIVPFQDKVKEHTEPNVSRVFFHMFTPYFTEMLAGTVKPKSKSRSQQAAKDDTAVIKAACVPSMYMPTMQMYYSMLVTSHAVCTL